MPTMVGMLLCYTASMKKILLIEDDERMQDLLQRYLRQYDFEVCAFVLPSEALRSMQQNRFDLVILDIMLPEMDGFEVCKRLRQRSNIPVIMLTARGDVMDRVVGLEIGADDYLGKPFEPRELLARINRVLSRSTPGLQEAAPLCFKHVSIDKHRREVLLDGQLLELSTMEFSLLGLLAGDAGKTFSRDEILNGLKGIDADVYSRSVDILVSRLRQKLQPYNLIKTIRGSGYVFIGEATL